jgi:Ca-activated chloride channel family protein
METLIQLWQSLHGAWQNFDFLWPWMIAFLPLPFIVRLLLRPAPQPQVPLYAPHLLQRLQPELKEDALLHPERRRHQMPYFALFLWLLCIIAAMRPIWYLTPTPFQKTGKDLILAVDLSGSMQKNDMALGGHNVDRLTAVKSVVKNFIRQRKGDRMALVVFGTQAFIQTPLTYDLNTVAQLLDETQIGMAGNNTAIGDAIGLTLKHLEQLGADSRHAVLILLTDGSNTAGTVTPIEAAEKAKQMGLKIYTIGVGKVSKAILQGMVQVRGEMDVHTLKKIAEITGGKFFLASDARQLEAVYDEINQLEASPYQVHQYRLRTELYPWPLGLALLLSFIWASALLLPQLKRSKPKEEA